MRDKLYDTELSDAAWASISDQRAGTRLLGGLRPVFCQCDLNPPQKREMESPQASCR